MCCSIWGRSVCRSWRATSWRASAATRSAAHHPQRASSRRLLCALSCLRHNSNNASELSVRTSSAWRSTLLTRTGSSRVSSVTSCADLLECLFTDHLIQQSTHHLLVFLQFQISDGVDEILHFFLFSAFYPLFLGRFLISPGYTFKSLWSLWWKNYFNQNFQMNWSQIFESFIWLSIAAHNFLWSKFHIGV